MRNFVFNVNPCHKCNVDLDSTTYWIFVDLLTVYVISHVIRETMTYLSQPVSSVLFFTS